MTSKEERANLCGQEIVKILEKYECVIIPEMRILGKEIVSTIHILAKEIAIDSSKIKTPEA